MLKDYVNSDGTLTSRGLLKLNDEVGRLLPSGAWYSARLPFTNDTLDGLSAYAMTWANELGIDPDELWANAVRGDTFLEGIV